ncbi:MAG TPA: DUF4175 family protein [Longimicrobiales bacterium]|nr:DUF4175 family protein [Longimicrobiales bacterium]
MKRSDPRLLDLIRAVRNRWRAKLLVRGLAFTGAAALALFVLLSYVVSRSGFTPAAVITLRVLGWGGVLAVAWYWLVRPLLRRPSDQQVALYIEENEPALRNALVSSIDSPDASPTLLQHTLEQALRRMHTIDDGRDFERRDLRWSGAMLAGVVVLALALVAARPVTLRHGADALLNPIARVESAQPFSIDVLPGDTTIARGADATVHGLLRGFTAAGADVLVRTGSDSSFARIPMEQADDSTTFEAMLFTLRSDAEYFIESGDVRSRVHRITVADLPYVERLAMEYVFPAYTRLPPQVIEIGGDIAALRGTTVRLTATPTVPVSGGRIVLEGGATRPLTVRADGTLTGELTVQDPGYYHLELDAGSGMLEASPRYTIDVLDDRGPTVRFSSPGRDTRPTSIEEVYLEAQADDDYGVARIELVYSVNGGAEQSVPIYQGRALQQVTAGHTVYLEEMNLEAGDLVSYYARARDNSTHEVTSDIYFLAIRPFGRDYRQAEQAPPAGAQQGEESGDLTQTQREIIAATFNVIRAGDQQDRGDDLNTIALAQERLRGQVETLAQRMHGRGITADTSFRRIAEVLPQAMREMEAAVRSLRAGEPDAALPSEQRALQQLQRAEAMYRDVQVAMQQDGGGGGSGGAPDAEDLADLFELELDRLQNQYETVQQGQQEATQQGMDATLERLRELARRQQQELERQRRTAASQNGQGGGSASQRQLAEETEQAARQLERLARETGRRDLEETARRMQEAADAMRRAAADRRSGSTAQAQDALERLDDARRRLEQNQSQQLDEETERARRDLQRLAEQQERVAEGMRDLQQQTGAERSQRADELIEQKTEMAERLGELEQRLDGMASGVRDRQNAARQLRAAAGAIRDQQLREMLEWSRNLTQPQAPPEQVERMEQQIAAGIEKVRERLDSAQVALASGQQAEDAQRAIERAAELARGLESLQAQAEAQASAERQSQPGQQAQQSAQSGDGTPRGGGDGRQLRNALRQRIAEAEELRQQLRRGGIDADQLEDVLSAMRGLDRAGALTDPEALTRLRRDLVDGARELEFALRRALLAGREDAPRIRSSGQVAEEFRRMVEEYYRALARQP